MKNYVIIDADAIQKRIEELKEYVGGRKPTSDEYAKMNIYNQILSQSTPLIPEIEKAFDAGSERGEFGYGNANDKQDYITNLKLDI